MGDMHWIIKLRHLPDSFGLSRVEAGVILIY